MWGGANFAATYFGGYMAVNPNPPVFKTLNFEYNLHGFTYKYLTFFYNLEHFVQGSLNFSYRKSIGWVDVYSEDEF